MKFSKDGASPDPQKVEAIKVAEPPPRNARELNSFLCTVQYNARIGKARWEMPSLSSYHPNQRATPNVGPDNRLMEENQCGFCGTVSK